MINNPPDLPVPPDAPAPPEPPSGGEPPAPPTADEVQAAIQTAVDGLIGSLPAPPEAPVPPEAPAPPEGLPLPPIA